MEDHDGAYHAWRQARVRRRVLVHIDGHLDWDWIPDKDPAELLAAPSLRAVDAMLRAPWLWNVTGRQSSQLMHIGNYINPALRDGMIDRFYWVVPDVEFEGAWLGEMLREMCVVSPRRFRILEVRPDSIVCEIDGVPLTACRLSALPRIDEPVLLDIDTDYLFSDQVAIVAAGRDPWRQLPWMWPATLVQALRDKSIRSELITIAYSVEGGFTPLMYKHLGDELAARLAPSAPSELDRTRFEHHQRAALHRTGGRFDRAAAEYEALLAVVPRDAAAHFNLAYLKTRLHQHAAAGACYRRAVELDPRYATGFNTFGSVCEMAGRLDRAHEEYERMLRWDPQSADARFGMARVLARRRRWADALAAYRAAVRLRPGQADAHRGLGSVYAAIGRSADAIREWEQARALEPDDAAVHLWLGRAYGRAGRPDDAIAAYRTALRCGARGASVYFHLSALHLRTGRLGPTCLYGGRGVRRWLKTTRGRVRTRTRSWLGLPMAAS